MMNYQLIIRVPFEAHDDVDGRQKARDMLKQYNTPEEAVIKLQKIHERSEPTGIKL